MVKTRGGVYRSPPTKKPKPAAGSARKVRNKVVSPTARRQSTVEQEQEQYTSDDFDNADEEDLLEKPADTEYASDSSQGSIRRSLPVNLQRTLVADIQSRGGITKFDSETDPQAVRNLCDTRLELYGGRGDQLE